VLCIQIDTAYFPLAIAFPSPDLLKNLLLRRPF
jgi:hypothetical protein